ncbi:MAG: hypothetical protein HOM14_03575 [Gammaproteobacteria bacterium]|jgi:hypothetical protein|nr:hypothetical protein [Gammaproteobacteria bacterium]
MIEFKKITKRQWKSVCGCYLILATGKDGSYLYSASYKGIDDKYEQLGVYANGTPKQNAELAKAACESHKVKQG